MTDPLKKDHELCVVKGMSGDQKIHVTDLSVNKGCLGRMAVGVSYDRIDGEKCEMASCGRQAYSVCGTGTKNCCGGRNATCGFKPCGKHLCENHMKQWTDKHGLTIFTSCRWDEGDIKDDG